jgi:hypothetical protein
MTSAPLRNDSSMPSPGTPPAPSLQTLKLWKTLRSRPWTTLVVLPAHPGGSAQEAADAIVEAGAAQAPQPVSITVIDARGVQPGAVPDVLSQLKAHAERGSLAVLLIDSLLSNPAAAPLATAADAALLCFALGKSDFASARETLSLIGPERVVGSMVLPGGRVKAKPRRD